MCVCTNVAVTWLFLMPRWVLLHCIVLLTRDHTCLFTQLLYSHFSCSLSIVGQSDVQNTQQTNNSALCHYLIGCIHTA